MSQIAEVAADIMLNVMIKMSCFRTYWKYESKDYLFEVSLTLQMNYSYFHELQKKI